MLSTKECDCVNPCLDMSGGLVMKVKLKMICVYKNSNEIRFHRKLVYTCSLLPLHKAYPE